MECEWYTDVCTNDRIEELSSQLGYRVKRVRNYIRDYCPFGTEVDIYDTMALTCEYTNGGILNYSLNASVPFEGWNLAINGTNGRIESQITDNKPRKGWQQEMRIVSPDGKVFDGTGNWHISNWPADYSIHVMLHDKPAFEVKEPNITEGHGGGDFKLFDYVFADKLPENDEIGVMASAIDGAYSSAIGAAANLSINEKRPVTIEIK